MAGISAEGDDTFHLDLIIGESVWSELMFLLIEFEELILPLTERISFHYPPFLSMQMVPCL